MIQENNQSKLLTYYYKNLPQQTFITKFNIELPELIIDFVLEEFTSKLKTVNVLQDKIDFLVFYPYLQSKLKKCLGMDVDQENLLKLYVQFSISFINFWNQSVQEVKKILQKFNKVNFKSTLVNRMIIISLVRQLSNNVENKIKKKLLVSKFNLIKRSSELIKFLIERFQVFQFQNISQNIQITQIQNRIYKKFNEQSAKLIIQSLLQKSFQSLEQNVCIQTDGKKGILISNRQISKAFLVFQQQNQIIISNYKFLQGWSKFQFTFTGKHIDLKNTIHQHSQQNFGTTLITNSLTNIGSSLGYLLANMPNQPSKFIKEFFLACTISGSMTMILNSIPILGKLILIGGLGYQALTVLKNTDIDTQKKFQKLCGVSFSVGVTLTSSIYGAIGGQLLIPVPILGAFIGGMIGGMIGGTSSVFALNKFQEIKMQRMIQKLQLNQESNGSWQEQKVIKIFHLKISFFQKYQKQFNQQCRELKDLINLFTYFLLTIMKSQEEQNEIQEINNKYHKKWYQKKKTAQQQDIQKSKILIEVDQLTLSRPQVLQKAQAYLLINNIILIDNLQVLQKMSQEFFGLL